MIRKGLRKMKRTFKKRELYNIADWCSGSTRQFECLGVCSSHASAVKLPVKAIKRQEDVIWKVEDKVIILKISLKRWTKRVS